MRAYTFKVTGGSPYDGAVVVAAEDKRTARKAAEAHVKEYNRTTPYSQVYIEGLGTSVRIKPPTVVFFDSGEA